jgi:cyclin H
LRTSPSRLDEPSLTYCRYKGIEDDKAQRKEMNRIGRKLIACQNPEKADIVAVARAKAAEKREGSESDADLKIKKRKLEREKAERDGDVFGGDLKKQRD